MALDVSNLDDTVDSIELYFSAFILHKLKKNRKDFHICRVFAYHRRHFAKSSAGAGFELGRALGILTLQAWQKKVLNLFIRQILQAV